MDKSRIESFRAKLLKEKKRLEEELAKMHEENMKTTFAREDYGGDENYEDHMADAATNIFDRERDLSLEQNVKDLTIQVDEAIHRLDDGRYGQCTNCGKRIDEARLRAIPYADLCIDCKKDEERLR